MEYFSRLLSIASSDANFRLTLPIFDGDLWIIDIQIENDSEKQIIKMISSVTNY